MSLNLNCPNCGAQVGKIDGDKEIYFYKGNKDQPICKNCGSGKFKNIEINPFIFTSIVIIIVVILSVL